MTDAQRFFDNKFMGTQFSSRYKRIMDAAEERGLYHEVVEMAFMGCKRNNTAEFCFSKLSCYAFDWGISIS